MDSASVQGRWAMRLLASLRDSGLRDVVVSPGSRSTPLVIAAQALCQLRLHRMIDERAASFFALGQARFTGRPSLLICTSGTAAANYYPAVIEAHVSGIPLLIVSADRPLALQACGAPQTIDQVKLFGGYAQYLEVGEPSLAPAQLDALARLSRHAYRLTSGPQPMPVHLNFRATKPLEWRPRSDDPPPPQHPSEQLSHGFVASEVSCDQALEWLQSCKRPLVIGGPSQPWEAPRPAQIDAFVAASGAVLCAEATGQLRFSGGQQVDAFDWLHWGHSRGDALQPDCIVQLGRAPTSTALQELLSDPKMRVIASARDGLHDPFNTRALRINGDVGTWLERTTSKLRTRPGSSWQSPFEANRRAWHAVECALGDRWSEPMVVRRVVASLPFGSCLVVGNSLAARHIDRYVPATRRPLTVLSQRGASGIEGCIASTLGTASCCQAPTTLIAGDISALHDIGALWGSSALRLGREADWTEPVVLVILNNRGGRIFEQLPLSRHGSDLSFWTTPHELSFRGAAEQYGARYQRIDSLQGLDHALGTVYQVPGVHLLECVVSSDSSALMSAEVRNWLSQSAAL